MTSREIIIANIECVCEERIGFSFSTEGWKNDFTSAGVAHGLEPKRWVEGDTEYYYDIWGNLWHRLKGMSAGGEVLEAVLDDWSKLDSLELPN
ncbi:MAG: hypothetical protein GXP32_03630, partial [Kiritimatiellaeota bacterium]|nr:hypothetical protein [Kiritimatiellota bacterium]